ncbi:MAG: 50S ribosomal protein L1 [Candidatus Saccharimonadia bacterium]
MPKKNVITPETTEADQVETTKPEDLREAVLEDSANEDAVEESEAATTKAGKRSAKAIREEQAEAERKAKALAHDDTTPKKSVQIARNPLKRHGKGYRAALELVDKSKEYELAEAIALAKQTVKIKFVPSLELHVNLGVDPRQADQMVRASLVLPAGTGKELTIAVLGSAAKQAEAKDAGAQIVGEDDLIAKIESGTVNFDKLIATPELMPKLAKLAKILGPKGLMPNPKSGTVTSDVAKAVRESRAGKVEFRIDKQAIIHQAFGKANFTDEQLMQNVRTLIDGIMKAKPAATKGTYVKAMSMSTTMGPGIKINVTKAIAEANPKK